MAARVRLWWALHRLKSGNPSARRNAARTLGELGDMRATQPLLELVADRSQEPSARTSAAHSLGRLRANDAVDHLIGILSDHTEKGEMRSAAVQALGELGDKRAVEPLIVALDSPERASTAEAAEALAAIGDPRAVAPLIGALGHQSEQTRRAAAGALGRMGEPSWQSVVTSSNSSQFYRLDECDDRRVVHALVRIARWHPEGLIVGRPSALAARQDATELIRALQNDQLLSERLVYAISELGDVRAVEPLIALLGHARQELRLAAARALGKLGDPRATNPMLSILSDPATPDHLRAASAAALGKLGDRRAAQPLLRLGASSVQSIRERAIVALAQLGENSFVDALRGLIRDSCTDRDRQEVLNDAVDALISLAGTRAIETLLDLPLGSLPWVVPLKGSSDAACAVAKLGSSVVEPLIAALDGPAQDRAIEILGAIGDRRAVEPLLAVLLNKDSKNRIEAARALKVFDDERAVPPLLEMLKGDNYYRVEQAARCLGAFHDRRAVAPLIGLLQFPSTFVRSKAAYSLGLIGDRQAVLPLIAALADAGVREPETAQAAAAEALGMLGDPLAVEPLAKALRNPHSCVREKAKAALEQLNLAGSRAALDSAAHLSRADILRMAITAIEDGSPLEAEELLFRSRYPIDHENARLCGGGLGRDSERENLKRILREHLRAARELNQ